MVPVFARPTLAVTDVGSVEKLAMIVLSPPFEARVHEPVPEHAPPQPENVNRLPPVAVKVLAAADSTSTRHDVAHVVTVGPETVPAPAGCTEIKKYAPKEAVYVTAEKGTSISRVAVC